MYSAAACSIGLLGILLLALSLACKNSWICDVARQVHERCCKKQRSNDTSCHPLIGNKNACSESACTQFNEEQPQSLVIATNAKEEHCTVS
ncbi:hypothetical protein P5V15_015632 [Pogonomyrmex californicus]